MSFFHDAEALATVRINTRLIVENATMAMLAYTVKFNTINIYQFLKFIAVHCCVHTINISVCVSFGIDSNSLMNIFYLV